jgi:filamentous hemagglutinin family protein
MLQVFILANSMKCIPVVLSLSYTLLGTSIVQAQIKPDNTLGTERSTVNNNLIQGGAQRGTNLFHSFTEFSIGDSQRVDFANPVGVKNILTRVTDAPSNINGTLGVLGGANLFLINPNGILFGQNARLDMSGIFVGTTANGLKFADGNVYGTVNPQMPLLTMTTPVGLQFGSTGDIKLTNSTTLLARDPITNYGANSAIFAGGNITLTGSKMILPDGKLELAAVNSPGIIGIDVSKLADPKSTSLSIPVGLQRGDILIQTGSTISTSGMTSGNIDLQAHNITIAGADTSTRSVIKTRPSGQSNTQGGSINLNATGDVLLSGNLSGISTSTLGSTNGGDITVTAQNLNILDGAYLETSPYTSSSGNGGNISIVTTNIVQLGAPTNGEESDIITGSYGSGNSGNITIQAGKLINKDGAQIRTDNLGTSYPKAIGKLGNIEIVARESVEVSGVSSVMFEFGFPNPTSITSFSTSQQDAGNIDIQTPKFSLTDGASISAGTDGSGLGGSIAISGLNGRPADSVQLVGNSNLGQFLGTENNPAFAGVGNGSRIRSITSDLGNAGLVKITADRVTLAGGSRIDVSTLDRGQGGSIDIQAKTVELTNGGQLISTTKGSGQAGKVNIQADRILNINGTDPTFEAKRTFLSLILVVSNQPAARQALNDYLQQPNPNSQQSLLNYWQQINPHPSDRQILQQYFVLLQSNPTARTTLQSFLTKTSGQTSLSDYNILLNVGNNSGIVSRSQANSTGNGGNITVTSPTLSIQNNGLITANSNGTGRGGNITATAETIDLNRGAIVAQTKSANGGEIDLNPDRLLLLRNQSEISASAATNGNGGNISIFTPTGLILAVPIENSDITASAVGGQGGKIKIEAANVLGFSTQRLDSTSNIAATSSSGSQGIVTISRLGNDPTTRLQPEPTAPSAPGLSQACAPTPDRQASQFIDSGKGGVTPMTAEPLRAHQLWSDPRAPVAKMPLVAVSSIEVAQGWKMGDRRTVVLTSQPVDTSQPAVTTAPTCIGNKSN